MGVGSGNRGGRTGPVRLGALTALFDFSSATRRSTPSCRPLGHLVLALRGIQDHLFTGIGLGVFNDVMPVRYPYRTVGLSYPVSQAHNLFLDVALAIGIVGALGLGLLLAGSGLTAFRGWKERSPSGVVSLGVLASIVAFLVFGITDSISLSIPSSFIVWLWACALIVLHERSPQIKSDGLENDIVLDSRHSQYEVESEAKHG